MKRKTKADREAEQKEALLRRLQDIFAGAAGYILDVDGDHACPENLERIIPVCQELFNVGENIYVWSPFNLGKWSDPQTACDFLFNAGARA